MDMDYFQDFEDNWTHIPLKDAEKKLNEYQNSKLNLCFIGETKSGKSTLINSLRGLYPKDPGTAETGVIQCTMCPQPYPNPENTNIIFWDAPGVNTHEFEMINENKDTYLEQIKFLPIEYKSKIGEELYDSIKQPIDYDCYIICYKDTIHANDLEIAKQIKKEGLNYYFVRTNIDRDLQNQQQSLQKKLETRDIEALFDQFRKNITDVSGEFSNDRIFLVSALMDKIDEIDNRNKYEFAKLQLSILNDLEENKKVLFISSMYALNKQGLKVKFDMLRSRILTSAAASAVGGLSPIPGTSLAIDTGILVKEVVFYIKTLKLTNAAIKKYVEASGVDYATVKREILLKNTFLKSILEMTDSNELTDSILTSDIQKLVVLLGGPITNVLLNFLTTMLTLNIIEEGLKGVSSFIPLIGNIASSILGATLSGTTTYFSLKKILDNFEETLDKVYDYCQLNRNI